MRKLLIILAFLPLVLGAQVNNVACSLNNELSQLDGALWYFNTLNTGLVLSLKASSISEDLLTYNSSGNLITAISGVNVTLDGSSEVVIGNSVRFGTPTSGTIYQVVDTGASALNLVLNQTFTGSVTDEYYWGGINTWIDESNNANNAIQTVATRQPKLLWYNTDSVAVCFDGINDHFDFTEKISHDYISMYWNALTREQNQQGIFGTSQFYSYLRYGTGTNNQTLYGESNTNSDIIGLPFTQTVNREQYYKFIVTNSNKAWSLYIDSELQSTDLTLANMDISVLGEGRASTDYFAGSFKDIYIFSRVLTEEEIESLSK